MLDPWNHQGKFAEDYVRALASAAGLLVYKDDLDYDGIDLGFRYPGRAGHMSSPSVEVQIKSCSNPRFSGGELLYDGLTEVQYNKLVDGPFTVPRYLFVVVVPQDRDSFATVETRGTLLSQLAYFHGFEGEAAIPEPKARSRHRVRVPLANVLTARTLLDLVRSPAGSPVPAA
ncbi:DUF4365 domain-containing protein [Actinomadura rayongensis]|uniref:DUF4365 domain-containing protein n=1 Tax=Actinomadura rayongensis TaxID=1429076 RepID=A0A6I4W990_9ACTN|nr:DUF4365 domain-containing protein [Actinomadura rayongensis]